MSVTQITDVVVPEVFTAYQVENSLNNSPLMSAGIVTRNGVMAAQLKAGAHNFNVPFWNDLPDEEANIANSDPTSFSTPHKISAGRQLVRKSFLHNSWSVSYTHLT